MEKGVTEVLKTRGDITISNITLLIEKLKGQQLSFIQMCKPGVRTEINYNLEYFHNSHDYPADVIMYGDAELMLNYLISQSTVDNIEVVIDPERLRPIDADLQVPDTTKFQNHTGWKPEYTFEQTMNDLLQYYLL